MLYSTSPNGTRVLHKIGMWENQGSPDTTSPFERNEIQKNPVDPGSNPGRLITRKKMEKYLNL